MGSVTVTKQVGPGEEEQLAVLSSGSHLGEAMLVDESTERAITAKALEKTFVLAFNPAAFRELCEADFELGYHAYRAIALGITKRASSFMNQTAYYKAQTLHH